MTMFVVPISIRWTRERMISRFIAESGPLNCRQLWMRLRRGLPVRPWTQEHGEAPRSLGRVPNQGAPTGGSARIPQKREEGAFLFIPIASQEF